MMEEHSQKLYLGPITKHNYEQVCELDVHKNQENYVACNMWSLVEAQFSQGHTTRAIYQGDKPVGFFMWVQEAINKISIWRFMVDKQHQHKGIGRLAMQLALNEIKQTPELTEIEICYHPNNPVAASFYQSFGFKEVGMDEDNEDMLAVISLK